LIAHKTPNISILQVGGVTPELTNKLLSILQIDKTEKKRSTYASFCDRYQKLIEDMDVKYQDMKPAVTFTHVVSGDLPQSLKDSSVDVVIFSCKGLMDKEQANLTKAIGRVLKLGGKALSFGPAGTFSTE
jgi:hypothetical protein